MDDCLFFACSHTIIDNMIEDLHQDFQLKPETDIMTFLGIKIVHNETTHEVTLIQPTLNFRSYKDGWLSLQIKTFNSNMISNRRCIINMSQFTSQKRTQRSSTIGTWFMGYHNYSQSAHKNSWINIIYPQWEGQLTWCQDEPEWIGVSSQNPMEYHSWDKNKEEYWSQNIVVQS